MMGRGEEGGSNERGRGRWKGVLRKEVGCLSSGVTRILRPKRQVRKMSTFLTQQASRRRFSVDPAERASIV